MPQGFNVGHFVLLLAVVRRLRISVLLDGNNLIQGAMAAILSHHPTIFVSPDPRKLHDSLSEI